MGKITSRVALLAAMVLSLLALPVPVASAQAFDLTVLPAKNEITAEPGSVREFTITVRNHVPEAMDLKIYPMDYYITPDNQFVFEEPGHYTYSCVTWLRFDRDVLSMRPNSEAQVPVRVEVPPDAEPGGHFAVVFFEKVLTPEEIATGAQLAPRVGALVLLTVPGEIVREAVIRSFSVESDFFSLWGPSEQKKEGFPVRSLRYRLEVENPGNVHVTVRAFLGYRPSFGFGRGEVELGEMTILPGTVRYFEGYLPNPPRLRGVQGRGPHPVRQGHIHLRHREEVHRGLLGGARALDIDPRCPRRGALSPRPLAQGEGALEVEAGEEVTAVGFPGRPPAGDRLPELGTGQASS